MAVVAIRALAAECEGRRGGHAAAGYEWRDGLGGAGPRGAPPGVLIPKWRRREIEFAKRSSTTTGRADFALRVERFGAAFGPYSSLSNGGRRPAGWTDGRAVCPDGTD